MLDSRLRLALQLLLPLLLEATSIRTTVAKRSVCTCGCTWLEFCCRTRLDWIFIFSCALAWLDVPEFAFCCIVRTCRASSIEVEDMSICHSLNGSDNARIVRAANSKTQSLKVRMNRAMTSLSSATAAACWTRCLQTCACRRSCCSQRSQRSHSRARAATQ